MFYTYGGLYLPPVNMNNGPNWSMDYWTRSLFQRLTALIDIDNMPEAAPGQYGWDKDATKFGLFMRGYLIVFESRRYGVVPQPGAVTGFGLQYQPSGAIVNTPYFQFTRPLKIGTECELIKLTPDYSGIFEIVMKYAAELKEIDTSIKASARNSRVAFALVADSDKSARTLRAIRERIINGDDAIVDEKIMRDKLNPEGVPWYQFDQDLKKNYILGDLLEARRNTLVDFYREIGVRMIDDKKERMITSEVDAGNAETFIRSEVWIESLKTSCEKVNKMFGLQLSPVLNRPDQPGGINEYYEIEAEEVRSDVR